MDSLDNFLIEPPEKNMYFGIHIDGSGRRRIFYKNICFSDPFIAQKFFDQEIFSLPPKMIPSYFKVTEIFEWELVDKEMKLYEFPDSVNLVFGDSFLYNTMTLSMKLQTRTFPDIYYSSVWSMLGASDATIDKEEIQDDCLIFGVRLRPADTSPDRSRYISMRGEGLPGMWYVTIGMREVDVFPSFSSDETDHCQICPHRPVAGQFGRWK